MKILTVRAEVFLADSERSTNRQTGRKRDRHGEINSLFLQFCELAQNGLLLVLYKILFRYKLHETKGTN